MRRSPRPSTPKRRTPVPLAQASTSPIFHHRSPSSAPNSVRASPSYAPSELLHSSIDRRLLTPGSHSTYRTHPPSSTTTRATPPPLNTAARHCLHGLAVDPLLWCALPPPPCSAPPLWPPRDLWQHLATGYPAAEPPTSAPPRRPARSLCVVTTPAPARRVRIAAGRTCRFPRWAEPPGCGLVAVSTDRAWQAAMPRGL
jgi:hypothetical protein